MTIKRKYVHAAIYLAVCGLFIGLAQEIGLRLYFQKPIFDLRDWRVEGVTVLQTGGAEFNPLLGWTQASNVSGQGFNTLAYGIRKNSANPETLTEGAIVVVGDSFTTGSEVVDEESWPAQLERLLNKRVLNAGVGGYGVDQTVLNAERLLDALKPRLVILGVNERNINLVNYRTYSAPKPYFVQENGNWIHKNNPVPHDVKPELEPWYKTILAHSYAAHVVLRRFPDWWFAGGHTQFDLVSNNADKTSCYLLERLQKKLKSANARGLVVLQYGGPIFAKGEKRQDYVTNFLDCARAQGYETVDEYDALSTIAKRSIEELKKNYVMAQNDRIFGHMSAQGNGLIAGLIAERIQSTMNLDAAAPLTPPK